VGKMENDLLKRCVLIAECHQFFVTIRHFQGQYQEQRTITKQKKKRKQSKDNEEAFGIENVLLLIVFNDPSKH